jgi:hypothetical protein
MIAEVITQLTDTKASTPAPAAISKAVSWIIGNAEFPASKARTAGEHLAMLAAVARTPAPAEGEIEKLLEGITRFDYNFPGEASSSLSYGGVSEETHGEYVRFDDVKLRLDRFAAKSPPPTPAAGDVITTESTTPPCTAPEQSA